MSWLVIEYHTFVKLLKQILKFLILKAKENFLDMLVKEVYV